MKRFEKWSVWTTSVLTVVTGVGYFVTKYLFTSPDPYSVINHPWQPYFLKAHILVSPLLLFALGAVAVDHIWTHYVTGVKLSRKTAMTAALSVVPMVVTGYLIQVLTGEGWVRAMALSHIAFGVLYGAGFFLHGWIVRRARQQGELDRVSEEGPATLSRESGVAVRDADDGRRDGADGGPEGSSLRRTPSSAGSRARRPRTGEPASPG